MLRQFLSFLLLLICIVSLQAQTVIGERIAELQEANYTISGTATALEYDDGTISLVLSEDFDTPVGPDVRVYLNSSFSPIGAIELVNLTTINHFSGELIVEVPPGTDLDVNDKVVFYCFAFSQLWATGTFGDVINPNPMNDTCQVSLTATENWVTEINLCTATDGPQTVDLKNNIGATAGEDYAYLLTDENEVLLEVIMDSVYTFSEMMTGTVRVYGVSFFGDLSAAVGEDRHNTTASECYIHSGADLYLSVSPQGSCVPSSVEEQLAAEIGVYPNPAQDRLFLDLPSELGEVSLTIRNSLGQIVDRPNTPAIGGFIPTWELQNGQYWLVIATNEGQRITKPFLKGQ